MKVLYVGPQRENKIIAAILRRIQEENVVRNKVRNLTELEGIDAVVLVGRPESVFTTERDYLGFMRAAHEQGFVAAVKLDPNDLPYKNQYLHWVSYFDRASNRTLTNEVVIPLYGKMRQYYQERAARTQPRMTWLDLFLQQQR